MKKLCPKKILKRRSGINIGLQKMIISGVDAFVLTGEDSQPAQGTAAASCDDGTPNPQDSAPGTDELSEDDYELEYDEPEVIPSHICLPSLKELMAEADEFMVDVSDEINRLNEVSVYNVLIRDYPAHTCTS